MTAERFSYRVPDPYVAAFEQIDRGATYQISLTAPRSGNRAATGPFEEWPDPAVRRRRRDPPSHVLVRRAGSGPRLHAVRGGDAAALGSGNGAVEGLESPQKRRAPLSARGDSGDGLGDALERSDRDQLAGAADAPAEDLSRVGVDRVEKASVARDRLVADALLAQARRARDGVAQFEAAVVGDRVA